MISIKKQLLILALIAGVISPVCAMDSNQDSSGWFGWKAGIGVTSMVCAGVAYYIYNTWTTKPKKTRSFTTKPAVYFAQPSAEDIAKINKEREEARAAQQASVVKIEPEVQHVADVQSNAEELDAIIAAKQDDANRFNRLPLTNQKTEIATLLNAFVENPSDALQDTMRDYTQLYCQRVKSQSVSIAVEKFLAAKTQEARKAECIKIKKMLGLIYH